MIKEIGKRIYGKIKLQRLRKNGLRYGENFDVASNVNFGSEPYLISIGNNVRISMNTQLITHDGGIWTLRKMGLLEDADCFGKIEIGDNVNIGMNVIILPGVKIGDNCVIGAGAVVTKSVPNNTIVAGIPAKQIETIEEYYEKKKNVCDYTKHMHPKEKKKYLYTKYNIQKQ